MKKIATAILVFDLMAGLLFLGLWEAKESATVCKEVSAWTTSETGDDRQTVKGKVSDGETASEKASDSRAVPEQTHDSQEEIRKIAITFDDDVIIGLSQEISYKEAVSMI